MKKMLLFFGLLLLSASAFAQINEGDIYTEQQVLNVNPETIGLQCESNGFEISLGLIVWTTSCLTLEEFFDEDTNETMYQVMRENLQHTVTFEKAYNCVQQNGLSACIQIWRAKIIQDHGNFVAEIRARLAQIQMEILAGDLNLDLELTQGELNP